MLPPDSTVPVGLCQCGCGTPVEKHFVSGHNCRGRRVPIDARFWPKVDRSGGPAACWPWTAGRNPDGYGNFWMRGRIDKAHRTAWTLAVGEIPKGLHVLHSCDNPPCCNPAHLWLGTIADNSADKRAKGRAPTGARTGARLHPESVPRGSRNGLSKLTEGHVREMRRRYRAGGILYRELAAEFGVSTVTAGLAIRGVTWTHVQDPPPNNET